MGSVAIGLTVIRVHMQGYPVDRSANSPLLQFRYELCAINLQPIQLQADRVKVPGMDAVRQLLRKDEFFDLFEQLAVLQGNCRSPSMEQIGLAELMDSNIVADVGQVVFETVSDDLVLPGSFGGITFPSISLDAVERLDAHALGLFVIVGAGHAAFA